MTGVGAALVMLSVISMITMLSTIWRNGRLVVFKWSGTISVISLLIGLLILVR